MRQMWTSACLLGLMALGGSVFVTPAVAATASSDLGENEIPERLPVEWESDISDDLMDMWITDHDPEMWITHLEREGWDAEEGIVLETDILFSLNEWELPDNAGEAIAALVEEIPEGANIEVYGHTDSNPVDQEVYDFDNQELSENRAQATADALALERPDLEMTVDGFGDSEPAVTEDPEDPSTYAANRRVEIRFAG